MSNDGANLATLEEFRSFVKDYLVGRLGGMQAEIETIADADNLLGTGLIDSFLFIDLYLAIEDRTGVVIDLADVDIDQFSIAGLHRLICGRRAPGGRPG